MAEEARFKHLRGGARYEVVQSFRDHDGTLHPEGERFTFVGSSFLPYEDGLTLFVVDEGGGPRSIRLRWSPDGQGAVVDALETYLAEVPPAV
jgi:hypothetical protein